MGKVKENIKRQQPRFRMLGDKRVVPTQYHGKAVGKGNFMTGLVDGKLVVDENDVPIPLNKIGVLL